MNETEQWEFWNKAASWSLHEALALINGYLPRQPWNESFDRNDPRISGDIANEEELLEIDPQYDLVVRAILAGEILRASSSDQYTIMPSTQIISDSFIAWAEKVGVSISDKIIRRRIIQKIPTKTYNGKNKKRENALHTELKQLFIEWDSPDSNQVCWTKLKEYWEVVKAKDITERESVITNVVGRANSPRGECYIEWLSPYDKKRIFSRASFDNRMCKFRK